MGGVWHFLDFSHSSKSRKKPTRKKPVYGHDMDAPRNSMELPPIRQLGRHSVYENIQFSRQERHRSRVDISSGCTPIKKLIGEEIPKNTSTSYKSPSVIARLMGMDALPLETKPSLPLKEREYAHSRNGRIVYNSDSSSQYRLQDPVSVKQRNGEYFPHNNSSGSTMGMPGSRSFKPKPREHPQEEELQKFKKDFEAWQMNKTRERSRSAGLDNNFKLGEKEQNLADGKINEEKVVLSSDAHQSLPNGKSWGPSNYNVTSNAVGKMQFNSPIRPQCQANPSEIVTLKTRKKASGCKLLSIMESDEENESSPSTKIVILKPGLEDFDDVGRTWCCSPELVEREGSINAFLEEVKERLKMEIQGKREHEASTSSRRLGHSSVERPRGCCSPEMPEPETSRDMFFEEVKERLRMEIQGKSRNEASTSSGKVDNFSKERSNDPKQLAQHIARQIRESVSRDFETTMMRSESSRSTKSDPQGYTSDSTDLIRRDNRDLLSERLRNILRNDGDHVSSSITASLDIEYEREKFGPNICASKQLKKSHWEDSRDLIKSRTSSFRHEHEDVMPISGEHSPRNLVRSLSAPISRAAFSKVALDDRGMASGACILRNHSETTESTSANAVKSRKDRFSLKGRVSNLRHNLALKSKFFSKKAQPARESHPPDSDFFDVSTTAPSVLVNLGTPQENLTEVPPSPASISSSSLDDFGKPGQPSPISPLEVPFNNGHLSPQSTKDACAKTLSESPLETVEFEQETNETNPVNGNDDDDDDDEIIEVSDQDEAYIRDVLVSAGLYGRSAEKSFTRFKMLSQPVPTWVFNEVEEAYNKCEKIDSGTFLSEVAVSRKLLFDLLNEALPTLLRPAFSRPDIMRFSRNLAELHGKKLLHDLWQEILTSTQALDEEPFSLNRIIVQDLRKTPWSVVSCDGVDGVAKDVESMILEQLLDELASELCLSGGQYVQTKLLSSSHC